ncbi:MAG: hypothetical protein HFF82_04625 [Oscillospiraceae bacterium]|nr:hypothetical protein [Oscillospiraceae bacterium]
MAVMGTFSSFTGARLAIYASQASLNVTGNNIANINTKGYTRQRMDLVSLHSTGWPEYRNSYQVDIGYGVLCDQVSQLRDPFLDIRYRNENAELGFYETKQDALSQLASILDEVAKGDDYFGVIEKQLGEVFETLENLKQRPGSNVYDDQFRAACYTLTGLLNDSAKRLETVRDNKAEELKQDTNKVNLLLKEIRAYNDEIRTQGICGDNALELRDARNVAIDELSKYVKIDVKYSNEYIDQYTTVEKLSISLAGTQPEIKLIDGIYGTQFMMNETVPQPNPEYDPFDPKGMQYIGRDGKPTDNPREAEIVHNPGNDKDKFPYLKWDDATGDYTIPTADPSEALRLNNQGANKYDPTLSSSNKYLKPGAVIINGKVQDPEKFTTDDPTDAAKIPAFSTDEANVDKNTYLYQLEPLRDKDGRLIRDKYDQEINEIVDILDTTLVSGSLQATREFLTEEGEFSSAYDIAVDKDAANKRGVRYYQRVLDSWAQKFAETFNETNQMPPSVLYKTDADGNFLDENGKKIETADGALIQGNKELVSLGVNTKLSEYTETAIASLQANGQFAAGFDIANAFKTNAKGEFVDSKGEPLLNAKGEVMTAKDFAGNQTEYEATLRKRGVLKEDLEVQKAFETKTGTDGVTTVFADTTGNRLQTPKDPEDYNADELAALRGKGVLKPEYNYYNGGVLFSNRSNGNDPTNITAKNISISYSWSRGEVRVLQTKQPNYVDPDTGEIQTNTTANDNLLHMLAKFDEKLTYEAKDVQADANSEGPFFKGTFQEMYTAISGTLGGDGMETNARYKTYDLSALDLDNQRSSVSGVDLNEEATNMMQFSKSYSAACRLLTTLDSMLDKLINGTAI